MLQVDVNGKLAPEVEDFRLEIADNFIHSVRLTNPCNKYHVLFVKGVMIHRCYFFVLDDATLNN